MYTEIFKIISNPKILYTDIPKENKINDTKFKEILKKSNISHLFKKRLEDEYERHLKFNIFYYLSLFIIFPPNLQMQNFNFSRVKINT